RYPGHAWPGKLLLQSVFIAPHGGPTLFPWRQRATGFDGSTNQEPQSPNPNPQRISNNESPTVRHLRGPFLEIGDSLGIGAWDLVLYRCRGPILQTTTG